MARTFILSVTIAFCCVFPYSEGSDPCDTYLPFTHEEKRYYTYQLQSEEESVPDYFLDDSLENWYGVEGYDVRDRPPGYGFCGGNNPVWLDWGNEEKITSGTRKVKACLRSPQEECSEHWLVTVKGCNTYRVYKLTKTPYQDTVYCTGPADDSKPPSREKLSIKPVVRIDVEEEDYYASLLLTCESNELVNSTLFFQTTWFVDGSRVKASAVLKGGENYSADSAIREFQLPEKKTGLNVTCAVAIRDSLDGTPGPSMSSLNSFVGIQILSKSVAVHNGNTTAFEFISTVPIKCGKKSVGSCSIFVEVSSSEEDGCSPTTLIEGSCGVPLGWNDKKGTIQVTSDLMLDYGFFQTTMTLALKTAKLAPGTMLPFLSDHYIGEVKVTITKTSSVSEGKACHAVVDPHMRTFDGRYYEHQYEGTFILYKHKSYPTEIQMRTAPCNSNKAFCASALAIRSHTRVLRFIYTNHGWSIYFSDCKGTGDRRYMGVEKETNGNKFRVDLPTGARIEIHTAYKTFLNVYIFPGPGDVRNTSGLCGTLTQTCTDDFQLRDESVISDHCATLDCEKADTKRGNSFPTFSDNWRVQANENLFDDNVANNLGTVSKQNTTINCKCGETGAGGSLKHEAICTETRGKSCFNDPRYETWEPLSRCVISGPTRKRRSLKNIHRSLNHVINKRENDQPMDTWDETTAREHCQQRFNTISAIDRCSTIEGVDVTASLEDCVLDILYTGVDDFLMSAVETVKSRCLHEVAMNTSVEKANKDPADNSSSVLDDVFSLSCTNECSSKGTCINGYCMCEDGFGAADCSVDLNVAPETYGLDSDGYCDLSEAPCDVTSVYADFVVDSDVTSCRLQYFSLDEDGNITEGDVHHVRPYVQSFSEAVCQLPGTRQRRSLDHSVEADFIHGYRVSISNDGKNFSAVDTMVVFDSACVDCVIDAQNVQCTFTKMACLSDGLCVSNGAVHPKDKCYVCNVTDSIRSWRKTEECMTEEVTDVSKLWVIAAVLGLAASVLVIISLVLAAWISFYKTKAKVSHTSVDLVTADRKR